MPLVKVRAKGNGNCAANAVAIWLCANAEDLKQSFDTNPVYGEILQKLKKAGLDIDPTKGFAAFEMFLRQVPALSRRQDYLAPIIRALVAKRILENQENFKKDTEHAFVNAFIDYVNERLGYKALDDVFVAVPSIENKFKAVYEENEQVIAANGIDFARAQLQYQLETYWQQEGFTAYFKHISANGTQIGDIELRIVTKDLGLGLEIFLDTHCQNDTINITKTRGHILGTDSNKLTVTLIHSPGHWDAAASSEKVAQMHSVSPKPVTSSVATSVPSKPARISEMNKATAVSSHDLSGINLVRTINNEVNDVFDMLDQQRRSHKLKNKDVAQYFATVFDNAQKAYSELSAKPEGDRFKIFDGYRKQKDQWLQQINVKSSSCRKAAAEEKNLPASVSTLVK